MALRLDGKADAGGGDGLQGGSGDAKEEDLTVANTAANASASAGGEGGAANGPGVGLSEAEVGGAGEGRKVDEEEEEIKFQEKVQRIRFVGLAACLRSRAHTCEAQK